MKQQNISIVERNTEVFKVKIELPENFDTTNCGAKLYVFNKNGQTVTTVKTLTGTMNVKELTFMLSASDNNLNKGIYYYEVWFLYAGDKKKTILQGKLTVVESYYDGSTVTA